MVDHMIYGKQHYLYKIKIVQSEALHSFSDLESCCQIVLPKRETFTEHIYLYSNNVELYAIVL